MSTRQLRSRDEERGEHDPKDQDEEQDQSQLPHDHLPAGDVPCVHSIIHQFRKTVPGRGITLHINNMNGLDGEVHPAFYAL